VVPYDLIPKVGDSEQDVAAAVRRAFGSLLATVSVEPTSFVGITYDDGTEQGGYRIEYRLVDCPTPAIMFVMDLDDCGLVPPLTQMYDTPPGRDWMDAERFRQLLRAWGRVSEKPFGGLTSYATAVGRYSASPRPGETRSVVDGKPHVVADLWVVTEGAATQAEFQRQQYDSYEVPGYVFSFPKGGTPKYLGKVAEIGWSEDLGD